MTVLKISCNSAIHRVQLDREPDFSCIQSAVQGLWPRSSVESMKYTDEEGDLCTLVEATFSDFVQTAQEASCGRQILKFQVDHVPLALAREDLILLAEYVDVETEDEEEQQKSEQQDEATDYDSFVSEDWEFVDESWLDLANSSSCETTAESPAGEVEDDTMKEIQAELDRIKAACEAELERHLDEWLPIHQGRRSYEDWIAAVHPENVKERLTVGPVIDQRMYLEGSFHRQLWNMRIAELAGLDEDERQRCYVSPREPGSAYINIRQS